jgi:hypothetical protein
MIIKYSYLLQCHHPATATSLRVDSLVEKKCLNLETREPTGSVHTEPVGCG